MPLRFVFLTAKARLMPDWSFDRPAVPKFLSGVGRLLEQITNFQGYRGRPADQAFSALSLQKIPKPGFLGVQPGEVRLPRPQPSKTQPTISRFFRNAVSKFHLF